MPAQGLIELKDHLTDLLDRYGAGYIEEEQKKQQENEELKKQLPESKSFRAASKTFYFDCASNARGKYVKISEVSSRFRTSITLPDNFLRQFRDLLNEYVDKIAVDSTPAEAESQ